MNKNKKVKEIYLEDHDVSKYMKTIVERQKKSEWIRKLTRKQMEHEKNI